MSIRILLADDHAVVRRGLHVMLSTQGGLELVGEASNGIETLELAARLAPDIILMDLQMPVLDGLATMERLRDNGSEAKVIVLTSYADQDHVLPAVRAGARGYLLKDVEPEDLIRAIRRVHEGKIELHSEIAGQLLELVTAADHPAVDSRLPAVGSVASPFGELTRREREVLELLASGKNNKEIAAVLYISEKTVKTHVSHVLDKLGVPDRTQAALLAVKHGH
ncbi:two component transcriptional regulator, LuxR family [Cohnella sp. OV330]|uniref:response regulator n=1 Tax=Cohnella sp. OV330 TaxID=1855288 RepID=UPI0008ED02CE|nr:response regulator transcription factor [Cohnella sp. OV330]SFA80579.1 two component transcriptional regulator, LuxR family [Cohnella sp. OV330]